jgi:hypothetical protein
MTRKQLHLTTITLTFLSLSISGASLPFFSNQEYSTCNSLKSCERAISETKKNNDLELLPVTYSDFEKFVSATNYKTDAEKYGWSLVQLDVHKFKIVKNATWKTPNGKDSIYNKSLPVTQVSYNDAIAYCNWNNKRLPTYQEYWEIASRDTRIINSNNQMPISDIASVNIVGNVWDITESKKGVNVRLAGGSLFCSEDTCNGTVKERELYVDRETGNIHIGFSIIK